MIKIQRDSGYADRIRAYKIILDNQVFGEVKNGQTLELSLPPGKHQIYLKIDWCRSNMVEFESDDTTVYFECGSNLRGWRILAAVVYVIFWRNKYIWLRQQPVDKVISERQLQE